MKWWNMSNRNIDEVSSLVLHQLPLDAVSWSDTRIRRFMTTVNPALLEDFIALAEAEILSEGNPGNLEETQNGIEGIRRLGDRMRAQLEGLSASNVRELALSGDDIIKILDIPPGPEVGKILRHLFDLVLENPGINTRERLSQIVEAEKIKGLSVNKPFSE
jgi:hypothetical protein